MELIATENQEQIALMKWASYHHICRDHLIFIENERKCSFIQGHLRKLKGVKAGVSDLLLAYPVGKYAGFWIELKKRGEEPNLLQLAWMVRMRKAGYEAAWFDDWEQAKIAIENYLCNLM